MNENKEQAAANIDLDKLEALARAATPGPWEATRQTDDECCFAGYFIEAGGKTISDDGTAPDADDAQFIAAANPATILALIDLARRSQPSGSAAGVGSEQSDDLMLLGYATENSVKMLRDSVSASSGGLTISLRGHRYNKCTVPVYAQRASSAPAEPVGYLSHAALARLKAGRTAALLPKVVGDKDRIALFMSVAPASAQPAERNNALEDAAAVCDAAFKERGGVAFLYAAQEIRALKSSAQPVAAAPAGWKWVPIEPTPEMINATAYGELATFAKSAAYRDYKAMVAAAPAAPVAQAGILAEARELLHDAAEPGATQEKADIGMVAQWDVDALALIDRIDAALGARGGQVAQATPASVNGRGSGCRMTGGICACRSGGSFGGCARERTDCCTNEPGRATVPSRTSAGADARDAARYRWLRQNASMGYPSSEGSNNKDAYLVVTGYGWKNSSDLVDKAIDAAMSATVQGGEK